METLEPIIVKHPFFAGMDESYVNLLVGCASNTRFKAGEYIFKEGEEANAFYLLRSGKVALEIFAPQRAPIIVRTLGDGEILGWSWLMPPYTWKFSAHALEDTRMIALDGKCLRKKCQENHDLGYVLMERFSRIMAQALESTRMQLLDVYSAK